VVIGLNSVVHCYLFLHLIVTFLHNMLTLLPIQAYLYTQVQIHVHGNIKNKLKSQHNLFGGFSGHTDICSYQVIVLRLVVDLPSKTQQLAYF